MEKPPRRSALLALVGCRTERGLAAPPRVNQSQKKPQSLCASGRAVQSFGVSLGRSCSGSARAAAGRVRRDRRRLDHRVQHVRPPGQRAVGVAVDRVVRVRRMHQTGEQCRLGQGQLGRRLGEVPLAGRRDAVRAGAEVGDVEVAVEDLVLVELPAPAPARTASPGVCGRRWSAVAAARCCGGRPGSFLSTLRTYCMVSVEAPCSVLAAALVGRPTRGPRPCRSTPPCW